LLLAGVAHAEITSLYAFRCNDLDLTTAGALDWVMFGAAGEGSVGRLRIVAHKSGGQGIWKTPLLAAGAGSPQPKPPAAVIRWSDGVVVERGPASGDAILHLSLGAGDRIGFEFAGKEGTELLASVVLAVPAGLMVVARQGEESRNLETHPGANIIQAKFSGAGPLRVELSGNGTETAAVSGIALTLSKSGYWWVRGARLALLYVPMSGDELRRNIYRGISPDYLATARAWADAMLAHGRDRYGEVHSPLFSNILTREREPRTTPYPIFGKWTGKQQARALERRRLREEAGQFAGPFDQFDYNFLTNYPDGLGAGGPHKTTLYGSDPFEDRDLYEALFELSRITGSQRYREAAEEAIRWWFQNTQGPSGLYPWGEHMGWDLENDVPTYFAGPSQHLYRANSHEVRDFVPFLDYLVRLPGSGPGEKTPLEKYALGIWETHFWDKDRAYFNRHGDYTGRERQTEPGAYPAHLAFYLRIWAAAYLHSGEPGIRRKIAAILDKAADMAVVRTERWGFFPQDLRPELEGSDPGRQTPTQSLRLAHHAAAVAREIAEALPSVSAKLRRLSEMHLGNQPWETTRKNLEWAEVTGDIGFLQGTRDTRLPTAGRPALSASVLSEDYATQILAFLKLYRETGQEANLRFARVYARLAYARFCDEESPLPRAFAAGAPVTTRRGEPFPDFYFKGAKLMRAFAQLGGVLQAKAAAK